MEGLGTWAPPFSLSRLGGRDRSSLTYTPGCRLHGGAAAGLAETEGRSTESTVPRLQTSDPDTDPAHLEWGSGGLQRHEGVPQGMVPQAGRAAACRGWQLGSSWKERHGQIPVKGLGLWGTEEGGPSFRGAGNQAPRASQVGSMVKFRNLDS